MPLANRDSEHLLRLRDHFAQHGALPSYSGISEVVGFRTKNAAVKLAQRLTADGYLRTAPRGKLAPDQRFFELQLMDAPVRAGAADSLEAQLSVELVTLDSLLIRVPSKTVLIRVRGDSMRDAGVLNGDLAVVERCETADAGQFVIAVVDDEFTLKELRFESGKPMLVPHNPNYAPIRPKAKLEVFGVVRGIVRHLGQPREHQQRIPSGAKP